MKIKDALIASRKYIKKGWTKGTWARNRRGGSSVPACAPTASCWCALGAMRVATGNDVATFNTTVDFFTKATRIKNIASWNDKKDRTKAQVLKALDRAIARAEKEGV